MENLKIRYVYKNTNTDKLKIVVRPIELIEKLLRDDTSVNHELVSRDLTTAVFDRNRKEAFDGDIILVSPSDKAEATPHIVKWGTGRFYLEEIGTEVIDWLQPPMYRIETGIILGNKHENPELLVSEDKRRNF